MSYAKKYAAKKGLAKKVPLDEVNEQDGYDAAKKGKGYAARFAAKKKK